MKLEGKVAIVTGGGQGIGQGIINCLAEEGADVAIVDINGDSAGKVAEEVEALGRKSLAIETDLTDSKQVKQAVQDIIDTFGKIDILVNNVGGLGKVLLSRTKMGFVNEADAEWDETYELNLKSHIMMCREVVPHLIKQKSGKIVNIASEAGKRIGMNVTAYGTIKGGVIYFTKSLAGELGEHNINVNCVCPGVVYTPFWKALASHILDIRYAPETKGMTPEDFFLKVIVEPHTPLKRPQTPEDIGRAVVFLVSEDAKNITGQALSVDGGRIRYP